MLDVSGSLTQPKGCGAAGAIPFKQEALQFQQAPNFNV